MSILQEAIVLSFAVLFIHSTTMPHMIFEQQARWMDEHLPEWLQKPLYGCPICMTPWWGTLLKVLLLGPITKTFIITLLAAGGISTVFALLSMLVHELIEDE